MTPPHTTQLAGRANWTLMTAVHDALSRDVDHLAHTTASHASSRPRWRTFRSQWRSHLATSTPTCGRGSGANWLATRTARPCSTPARLTSHLAHEEADALPLISQTITARELNTITTALPGGGQSIRRTRTTIPWALADASPDVREHVLSQLPAPARLLHRTLWLPRHRAAVNNTRPSQPLTSKDATNGSFTAVNPPDHMARMSGRFSEPSWWALLIRHARCADGSLDPDQWFPVSDDPRRARQEAAAAIAICTTCPVRRHCLALSLQHWDIGQHGGVWGGPVAADRARLRRRLRVGQTTARGISVVQDHDTAPCPGCGDGR